jgi:predicted oxidoreductase
MTPWAWGAMRACEGADTARPADLARFLGQIHDAGAAWIDGADIYANGACDALVGEALALDRGLRNRFKLIAKAGVVRAGEGVSTQHYRNDGPYLRGQLTTSLQRLGVEQADLFLVHRPDYLLDADETAAALQAMIDDGLTAAVGVSNFSAWQTQRLNRALGRPVAADQLEFSPLALEAMEDGRLDLAQMDGIDVFAWSPLAGGRLFNPGSEAAHRVRAALARLAGSDEADSIAGAALAWVARHPAQPVPILGSCRADRLVRQVEMMGQLEMSGEDWYAVLEASRGARVA